MSIDIPEVHAGQLITASFMNDVIDMLVDHEARLTKLEEDGGGPGPQDPSGAIVIDSVSPTTVRVGGQLTIKGKNFGDTLGASKVTIGGHGPALIDSWTATQIVVVVPNIPEEEPLPDDGVSVTLEVSNFLTSESRIITVRPRQQAQAGSLGIAPGRRLARSDHIRHRQLLQVQRHGTHAARDGGDTRREDHRADVDGNRPRRPEERDPRQQDLARRRDVEVRLRPDIDPERHESGRLPGRADRESSRPAGCHHHATVVQGGRLR